MRIAIDARMIRPGSMHGIARYVYQLLKGLVTIGRDHRFFVLVNRGSPLEQVTWPEHIRLLTLKSQWISLREQKEIPLALNRVRAELFHAPSFVAPMFVPCKMIMTIHDLNHMVLPQFYTLFHQFYYQVIVRNSIQKSEYILTVSNFSKKEIVRTLGLSAEKIFVTYNGVSPRYHPIKDHQYIQYVRDIYGLPERFILCVSNNKPHKNVHQLVRAYCYSDVDVPLVLACPVDRSLISIAENYGKKHLIYFSKFIEEQHLPAFYSMTELFVYPSTYEGFGLPPLEALSCGTPVVVARSSSLPEVVGQHAIFANPYDFKAIAEALELGIKDQDLRCRLRSEGLLHARNFSWEKMTEQTLSVYEQCQEQRLCSRLGVSTV
ncbi:glycosyltransferase family 4 protein [Pseudobacteriovorax antillogorgiicola]|uniref:Glycosyltransferase involved in cell wall bisynthesis n=1 Tax=Pseudobacteriovorax antillogorgiicola TaxID=1513793 RepID=A0A1Y6B3K3_9BACT|nr:glycosyltransferase family 1 protein [Pseudobacteriovorax antillogorgiicola]TCS59448.1 glycosyltransferase involved in cell wall biosynthesis [Pseudobacteriovorax antillogorgiicola]SME88225.1 Glycosyltransferase involved in cell wall bisynthesis [Pseudobacteriovorax antillogorgiicola]